MSPHGRCINNDHQIARVVLCVNWLCEFSRELSPGMMRPKVEFVQTNEVFSRHTLMETSQLNPHCLPNCVLKKCLRFSVGCVYWEGFRRPATGLTDILGHQQALLRGGKPSQPAKCFSRNFWLS